MGIDRYAATIVADREHIVFTKFNFDPGGIARHRLIHRVIKYFGGQMMQRMGIRAANIHTWPSPDWLKAFQNLDVFCGVVLRAGCARKQVRCFCHVLN